MALNKEIVGKKYQLSAPFEVTAHEGIYYALAYNEDNDTYFDDRRGGGSMIPPMYAVRYMGESIEQVLHDTETGLNFSMMVHHSQEFEWLLPVRAGDKIVSRAEITGVETGRLGGVLRCSVESENQKGSLVVKSVWSFLDRSAGLDKAPLERPWKMKPSGEVYSSDMKVRNGQTWIYAEPSGDFNPIHVDEQAAVGAGLDGIVLHGLCTMAFAHKACVDTLCGDERDPLKVRKLAVQFARPVKPGDVITFRIFKWDEQDIKEDGTRFGIIAVNQNNKNVLQNAWCLIK